MTMRPVVERINCLLVPRGPNLRERCRSHLSPGAPGGRMKHLTQWWQVAGASKGRIPLPTLDKRGHVRGKLW